MRARALSRVCANRQNIRFDMRCLNPIFAVDLGINKETGKRKISFSPKYGLGLLPLPCGKCSACRENRRLDWCNKMRLEAEVNTPSSFLTLTYNEESIPPDCKLSRSDVQKFLKRLRNASRDYGVSLPNGIRYFMCGEYGKKYHRPHYHGIIFGADFMSPEWLPQLVSFKDGFPIYSSQVIDHIWPNGFNTVDVVTPRNILYVSKYVNKSSDERPFYLSSIGLGRKLFCNVRRNGNKYDYRFKDCFFDRYEDGKIALFSRGRSRFVKLPSYLDRYAERFFPDLYNSVKASRREFVTSLPSDLRPSTSLERDLLYKTRNENQKRKLDNET